MKTMEKGPHERQGQGWARSCAGTAVGGEQRSTRQACSLQNQTQTINLKWPLLRQHTLPSILTVSSVPSQLPPSLSHSAQTAYPTGLRYGSRPSVWPCILPSISPDRSLRPEPSSLEVESDSPRGPPLHLVFLSSCVYALIQSCPSLFGMGRAGHRCSACDPIRAQKQRHQQPVCSPSQFWNSPGSRTRLVRLSCQLVLGSQVYHFPFFAFGSIVHSISYFALSSL